LIIGQSAEPALDAGEYLFISSEPGFNNGTGGYFQTIKTRRVAKMYPLLISTGF
jgi:hypothetical protein